MELDGAVVVVTGAASGIGAAMARRFVAEGALRVIVADRDLEAARVVAGAIGARAAQVDVGDEAAVSALVQDVLSDEGHIDLFCSNAGVATGVGLDGDLGEWRRALDINLMGHLYAARAVIPSMIANGGGYLLQTSSAAGLLLAPGDGPYTVSKHAAVALAEWLAVHYGSVGIKVSALCPLGVSTPLLMEPLAAGSPFAQAVAASGPILSADDVASAVVEGLRAERFLILPHPDVGGFWARKAADPDRWIAALQANFGQFL